METGKAKLVLEVDDLRDSLAFYTTKLGWEQVDSEPTGQAALLRAAPDYLVVLQQRATLELQNSGQIDLNAWLLPQAQRPKRGDQVYMGVSSVQTVERELRQRGFDNLKLEEDAGSVRKLFVSTSDGFTIVYWEELFPSEEEILANYAAGADELERLLQGMSDVELDAIESPGKWSIRQQVLHLIDLELVTIHKVKFALAEPGRNYQGNGFSQDDWCTGLDYARRPIEPEIAMFRAVREHIVGLCKHLPDAMQSTIVTSNREETVAKLLKMLNGHAVHHMRAIGRIRK
ncbi:DinB family protein [Paenibacillus sedimenti]|uniref:DinB family protein n=1 Tax=Paenibacillus sedimenti TaxID=2770274 RepID=A0A926QL85_9BACL|nr:DinB family protein [Paenibacillus sedimenti]MBD0382317.1 DinB family protein [Paenibacillus sedimenti]